jgi:isocitrate dehydrogenase (NAD+)
VRRKADTITQTPIVWEPINVDPILKDGKTAIPDAAIESIRKNKIALKGPLAVCAWMQF